MTKATIYTLIEKMQKHLKKTNEVDGNYSLNIFSETGAVEFGHEKLQFVYARDSKHGDHVYIETYVDGGGTEKTFMWAAKIADTELNSPVSTSTLPSIVNEGEVVCLLKNINDHMDIGPVVWGIDKYVTIPKGHMGMVKRGNGDNVGYVVVVPAMDLETV